jgi:hypothetical protein
MQMKPAVESMRWVIAQLAVIATGVAFILYMAFPLPSSKLIGGFLLAIGALNGPFYRITGRRAFAQMSKRPLVAWFWVRSGERGSQVLFLGIAIILAVAGCVLLIFGSS